MHGPPRPIEARMAARRHSLGDFGGASDLSPSPKVSFATCRTQFKALRASGVDRQPPMPPKDRNYRKHEEHACTHSFRPYRTLSNAERHHRRHTREISTPSTGVAMRIAGLRVAGTDGGGYHKAEECGAASFRLNDVSVVEGAPAAPRVVQVPSKFAVWGEAEFRAPASGGPGCIVRSAISRPASC